MPEPTCAVVTGVFSDTGQHATRLLLARGWRVRTLTHHPTRRDASGSPIDLTVRAGVS